MKNVQTKTTNFDMTPEVSEYLEGKLAMLDKLITVADEDAVRCDVEIEQVRDQHANAWRAELNLSIEGGLYRAEARGETAQAAIDQAKDELQRQLRRHKSKRRDLMKRGGASLKKLLKFGRK